MPTNYRQKIEERYADIRSRYGNWLSEESVKQIMRAESEMKACKACTGLPCGKSVSKHSQYQIKVEDHKVEIKFVPSCKYRLQALRQHYFKQSKIPPKYIGKTFEDYEVTAQNKAAVEWAKWAVKHPESGILYYGIAGVGKTFLASIIAQEHIKAGRRVIFGDVPSLLDDLKETFNGRDSPESNKPTLEMLMAELETVDVLVLDDIGTEYGTDWALERLYMIINNRYNVGKAIMATSNFNAEMLETRFKGNMTGKRIVSRLCEMCKTVELKGRDRRIRR